MNDLRKFFPELDEHMNRDEREIVIKSALAERRRTILQLTEGLRDMEASAAEAGFLDAATMNQYCNGSLTA